jgi:gas vesicle protein
MKMIGLLCFMISAGHQLQAGVTPVQKVIQMMEEMKSKAIAEKDKEIKLFKEYMSWCKDTTTDKKHEIITATDEIGRLEATIMKSDVAAKELSDKVKAIDEDIAMWSQDKDAATEVREKEHADYMETNTDYTESIDALGKAIVALSKSQGSVSQAMMLLQHRQRAPRAGLRAGFDADASCGRRRAADEPAGRCLRVPVWGHREDHGGLAGEVRGRARSPPARGDGRQALLRHARARAGRPDCLRD